MGNAMRARYVVGGGASGNVIAARLAAAGEEARVLAAGRAGDGKGGVQPRPGGFRFAARPLLDDQSY